MTQNGPMLVLRSAEKRVFVVNRASSAQGSWGKCCRLLGGNLDPRIWCAKSTANHKLPVLDLDMRLRYMYLRLLQCGDRLRSRKVRRPG